jgi:hypothetical protein
VLSADTVVSCDGLEIADITCRHRAGRGQPGEQTGKHAIVFVRRGYFVRSVDGVDAVLDPTLAYCINPGQEQRYDHPHDHGDDCTAVFLEPGLVASLWGGECELPSDPLPTPPDMDLEQRLLLQSGRGGADPGELAERAIDLTARSLEQVDRGRVAPTASAKRWQRTQIAGFPVWLESSGSHLTISAAFSARRPVRRSLATACAFELEARSSAWQAASATSRASRPMLASRTRATSAVSSARRPATHRQHSADSSPN